ncbi:MAG: hypothetical protein IT303_19100 [Dehalococcoidia bacterium]|nr:hypothetical protein [Dehalococcoidia bacterium]
MITCTRCAVPLVFLGERRFHEGTRVGFLGDLAELFQHREEFELFACTQCGSSELFIKGVGDDLRAANPTFEEWRKAH